MSLRNQIHSAFDETAPPTFGLSERVVQTVLTESPSRRRREKLIVRLRVPLSLVAVFVLIALVVGVLIGGRLIQDWTSFRNSTPAGGVSHASLAQLEGRPLQLTQVAASVTCPDGPVDSSGNYGAGPFHGVAQNQSTHTSWGTYWTLGAIADASASGLMLVRALDVKTQQPLVFVGSYSNGAVVGSDVVSGATIQQRSEMVLDLTGGKRSWQFTVGMPNGNSRCYGWQIDGDNFTETFVFNLMG